IDLGRGRALAGACAAGVAAAVLLFAAGAGWSYWLGGDGRLHADAWNEEFERQRAEIAAARTAAEDGVNALALRVGQLHARVLRLDALGQRLTQMADLDGGEFDFQRAPALGGPESAPVSDADSAPDFLRTLD